MFTLHYKSPNFCHIFNFRQSRKVSFSEAENSLQSRGLSDGNSHMIRLEEIPQIVNSGLTTCLHLDSEFSNHNFTNVIYLVLSINIICIIF
jgi:hypothetical protein